MAESYSGEAYCVKCKEKREFTGEVVVSASGRRMAQGICPVCGTYVATYMEGPRGPIGVINVAGLNIEEFRNLPVTLTSLEGETPDERIARRVSRWTPMILNEGESS